MCSSCFNLSLHLSIFNHTDSKLNEESFTVINLCGTVGYCRRGTTGSFMKIGASILV